MQFFHRLSQGCSLSLSWWHEVDSHLRVFLAWQDVFSEHLIVGAEPCRLQLFSCSESSAGALFSLGFSIPHVPLKPLCPLTSTLEIDIFNFIETNRKENTESWKQRATQVIIRWGMFYRDTAFPLGLRRSWKCCWLCRGGIHSTQSQRLTRL